MVLKNEQNRGIVSGQVIKTINKLPITLRKRIEQINLFINNQSFNITKHKTRAKFFSKQQLHNFLRLERMGLIEANL